jgi:putative heme-binding domain-containing protein
MAKFGRDRMPHIGSEQPDRAGLKLIEQWIAGMKGEGGKPVLPDEGVPSEKVLAEGRSALYAATRLGAMKPERRKAVLGEAAKLPAGPVRDLFEGYFATDAKGPRKLGSSPRPRTILALEGDPGRGEILFWTEKMTCGNCHKIGSRGTAVGPDLSEIGKQRTRADILESILEPSRRIEPKYATYVAQTTDGRSFTGLLVKRDAKAVVLRDAQNKEVTIAAKKVEELRPSRLSLMPDGLLAGLTAQEAADLLEYLATRK